MKSRPRYSLIAGGILAFIILTPFIILFVSGKKYDFKNGRFVKTGILGIKTEPKNASIIINGSTHGTTNQNIRFLEPADYELGIKKQGYFDWNKRLTVRPQFVTWNFNSTDNLFLFYSNPEKQTLAENVLDFFVGEKRIIYLQQNKISFADVSSPEKQTSINFKEDVKAGKILSSPDESLFLINSGFNSFVLDTRNNTLTDITELTAKQAAFSSKTSFQASENTFKFSPDNKLYQLLEGSIYLLDPIKNEKEVVVDNVLAFEVNSSGIYYIKLAESLLGIRRSLAHASLPNYKETILQENIQPFVQAQIYLTENNQLFVLGNGGLYILKDELKQIAEHVEEIQIENNESIFFNTGNEIDQYDTTTGETKLITRSSESISNLAGNSEIGWVFFKNNDRLQTIEMDTRDHQNNYTFADLNKEGKFFVDSDAKTIFLLNDGVVSLIKVR
ncbi:MAG: PEGA domain-containing protein [Candidatus Doudnabacteria bacterium]